MKNLFKNLMLVAVAAMAFTACTETNDEVNAVVKKTVINGVAMIDADDTRSGFVGSETTENENGEPVTVYKSAWDGDETIKLFAENGLATTATVDAEGKFTAEFEGELPESFFMTVCSPAEAWSDAYTYTIPTEQTPRAESVDPAAHIFQAQNVYVTNGTADKIQMSHQIAYGKMTVKGVDFKIDHVVVDLKGSFYGYARELSYTLNADNVENNTFWFATEIIDVANFTVTAYDAEGNAVTKSVDVAAADKTLAFNYGRVSTFSVSGLEAPVVPTFTSAYASGGYYTDFYLYFDDETFNLATLKLNAGGICDADWIMTTGEYQLGVYPGFYANEWYNYSTYGGVSLATGTVKIDIIDKKYHFEFINLTDWNGNVLVENAIYVGSVNGLNVPDPRIKLDAPNVTSQISGKTITLSWDPVTGADSYSIEIYSDAETVEPVSTTETHFEYTVKSYDSYYSFKVTAVVAEDDTEYRNSGYGSYVEYTDPREQLPAPTNVTATVDGLYVTISWDKVDNAVGYEINYYDNGNITKSTTETSITLEMSKYNNEYYFNLSSVADENSDSYRSSDDAYITATTERDPNAVVVEFTSMSYVGTEDTYPMYGEYCHVFELTNSNNYKMNLYVGSYQASSTTISEGSYHYEGKENLGYASTQWGFQSKIWNADGYVGAASSNSTMVVKRSGDVYNIDFTLIINDQTHFFVCNAPIGVQQQPVALETPVVSSSVNGNEVVVSWSAINGAANYTVTLGSQSQTVNGTTVTFSNLEYSTSYTVSVVANPADTTANLASDAGTATFTTEADPNAGGNEGGNDEWTGREVKLQFLAYMDNALYTNVNNESKYFMTSFRNGIVAGKFVLAGDNKSNEIMTSGHAASQMGLFGGTTPFADGDTVEVIDNGGGSYTIIYRVTVNGEKLTATYNGGL